MIIRFFLTYMLPMIFQTHILYQFSTDFQNTDWRVVDDVVMGGKSFGEFYVNKDGKGVFEGNVSLENNGGFSSVRHQLNKEELSQFSTILLRVKGDGKRYQFRLKDKRSNYYSYAAYFTSSTEWKTLKIPLSEMYPTFRGRKLNLPNFNQNTIEEIAFLIANKKSEDFRLEIDFIALE